MNAGKTLGVLAVGMVLTGAMCQRAFAQDITVEQKLNKDIKISLNDVLITEALDKISKEIEAPIVLSDEAEYKLPYGKSTRLSVTMKGPASESLTQMLNEFFMRYAIGQEGLVIYPRQELKHIIGRPSARQLEVLKAMYTHPIEVYKTDNVLATVNAALRQEVFISPIYVHEDINKALRKLAGEKKVHLKEGSEYVWYEMLPPDSAGKESQEYSLGTVVPLPQLLREAKIKWYEDDPADWYIAPVDLPNQIPEIRLVVYSKLPELTREQLMDVTFEDRPLKEVFEMLANRGGIKLEYGGSRPVFSPDLEQHVSVSLQNVTAMQAMKKIAEVAGLNGSDFGDESGDEFQLTAPKQPKPPAEPEKPKKMHEMGIIMGGAGPMMSVQPDGSSDDRGPYVGKISIPMEGGKYYIEYMLRESDLTDELKQLRAEKIREILGAGTQDSAAAEAADESK